MNNATPPAHPGVILLEKAMKPLGVSRNKLARDIDVPVGRISDIVSGKRGISPDTALRLAKYFGTSAEMWMRLQWEYDLYVARVTVWPKIDPRVRVFEPVDDAGHPGVRANSRQASEPVLPDLPDPVLPGSDGSVMKPDIALPEAVDDELAEIGHYAANAAADEAVDERELEIASVGFRRAAPIASSPTSAGPIGFALAQVAEAAATAVTAQLLRESRDELHEMLRAPEPVAAAEPQSGLSAAELEPKAATLRYEPVESVLAAASEPDRHSGVWASEYEPSAEIPPPAEMRDAEPVPDPAVPEVLVDVQSAGSGEPAERVVTWPTHDDTNGFEPAEPPAERESIAFDPPVPQAELEPGASRGDELQADASQPIIRDDPDVSEISAAEAPYESVPSRLNGHLDPVLPAAVAEEPSILNGSNVDASEDEPFGNALQSAAAEARIHDDGLMEQADTAFRGIADAYGSAAPFGSGAEPPLLDDVDDDEPLLLTEEMPSLDIPDPDDPRFRARRDGD